MSGSCLTDVKKFSIEKNSQGSCALEKFAKGVALRKNLI
jgi:hypothetical protein